MKVLNLPGPMAKSLIERDRMVISPSYPRGYPFVMDHGRGVEVWDVDGNRFLDFAAGIAVTSTGHSHPTVVKAIQEQAEKFIHISSDFYHQKWIELAEYLDRIAPFREDAISFMTNSALKVWKLPSSLRAIRLVVPNSSVSLVDSMDEQWAQSLSQPANQFITGAFSR